MNGRNLKLLLYYLVRPLIPRRMQLWLRGRVVRRQRIAHVHDWPIDPDACAPPQNWRGWPAGKKFALVLTHDVEKQDGQEKCPALAELELQLGFRSAFYFVPRRYDVSARLRNDLTGKGFEVGVHGLYHDGKLFKNRAVFNQRAAIINEYIRAWGAAGFRAPAMHHNLEWMTALDVAYDASTFDTDPFEPMPQGMRTIFPFWVRGDNGFRPYVELPYSLPQDSTLFLLLKQDHIDIWKQKLDWVAQFGGMALLITHPDYMYFGEYAPANYREYPAGYYADLLKYIRERHAGEYWNALPREVAEFWNNYREHSRPATELERTQP